MKIESDEEDVLRAQSSRLLRQITNGQLRRHHPKLVAPKGNWSADGDATAYIGRKIVEYRSYSFRLPRQEGEQAKNITIAFQRSVRRWEPSCIHLNCSRPLHFRWNGRRWLAGRRRVGL